jgi:diguanylate cyclase (GGDEF)-like protein
MQMCGVSQSLLDTKNFQSIVEYFSAQVDNATDLQKKVRDVLNQGAEVVTGKLIYKNGKIFEYFAVPHKVGGNTLGHVWSFRDITQQTIHDDLTGLLNREGLLNYLRRAIAIARTNKSIFGLCFIDLDRFKLINDSISREAGDEILCVIAKRLQATLRHQDIIARLGGDEFVALLPNLDSKKHLTDIANKIIAIFEKPITVSTVHVTVTGSIGISFFPTDGKTPDELLHNADVAMYHAKKMGRNQFSYYEENLNKENIEKFEKTGELRAAIEKHEFFLQYQPQIDATANKLIGVEALVRWKHPTKGTILPIDFIPLAEETGLIVAIDDWVFREACRQNREWQDRGFPPIRMAVNISTSQFTQVNFVSNIMQVLKETNMDPQFLEIELTENLIISNISEIKNIQALKDFGVQITLDDFGTGYSSLSYLKNISFDRLKIDKSFIDGICDQRKDQLIVKAIIAMAKSMSLEVIAEGVEKKTQLDSLKTLECKEIQGFYFGKPQSTQDLEKILSSKGAVKPFE